MIGILFWILIIIILSVQETFSSSWIITKAYQQDHHNVIYLSMIFLVTTIIEIPFFSNKKFHSELRKSWVILWIKRNKIMSKAVNGSFSIIDKINSIVGIRAKKIFLVYLSATVSPAWFNSLISYWLELTTKQIFAPVFIGVVFWYLSIMLTVTGVSYFVEDADTAMRIIIGLSFAYVVLKKYIPKKQSK